MHHKLKYRINILIFLHEAKIKKIVKDKVRKTISIIDLLIKLIRMNIILNIINIKEKVDPLI